MLRKNFFDAEQLEALVKDHHNAGLSDEEVAVMDFAMKVIHDAHHITPADIEPLRQHGLADEEIMDVILAASARSFFSLTLDALGAQPDEAYREHIHGLEGTLAVGRPYLPADE